MLLLTLLTMLILLQYDYVTFPDIQFTNCTQDMTTAVDLRLTTTQLVQTFFWSMLPHDFSTTHELFHHQ